MKDFIREIIDKSAGKQDNENWIREYIQKYFFYILYKNKESQNLIFTGGTALRFIHKIKRYSEDLDFSLSYKSENYDFLRLLKTANREFSKSGYTIKFKYSLDINVHEAFLKFPGLLYEYELSPHRDESLSIKIEIDTNPPAGGKEEVSLYHSTFLFYMQHYDIPSLFAGKLHALLCRKYTKGRDWYDLLWYLTKFEGLTPNFEMLNNAVSQVCIIKGINVYDWKNLLKKRIDSLDFQRVRNDVVRFLEDPGEAYLITRENLYRLLR